MRLFLLFCVCILVSCCLLTTRVKAQTLPSATVKLAWQQQVAVMPTQNLPAHIPAFKGATIDYVTRLPYFRFSIPNSHIGNLQLTETSYQPFTPEEQQLFGNTLFEASPSINFINTSENKVPASIVTILPIRRNPQTHQLEKLVQFSYSYTSAQATALHTTTSRSVSASFKTTSVLSSGNWYKLAVTTTGIHKIDKHTLQALGINIQNLNPKTIQIYGNGGGMLPQPNSTSRPNDLQENAILVAGEADGKFDDGDYVQFYAQGPHTWEYSVIQKQFQHTYNFYTDTAYYFLRIGNTLGKRVSSRSQATGATQVISTFDERIFHEEDLKNMVYSGREWYGEALNSFTSSRDVTLPVSDIVPDSEVKLTTFLMANAPTNTSFALKCNNQALGTQVIPGRGKVAYHPEGVNSIKTYTIKQQALGSATDVNINLVYNTAGSSTAAGYLNYLELNYERQLKLYGEQTNFRSVASTAAPISNFTVTGAPASAKVWDVSNPIQPILQQATTHTDNVNFTTATNELREFVVFKADAGIKPIPAGKVANQNLHSLNLNGQVDFVIVTHPTFLAEANRLADYRSRQNNMQVQVVTVNQVYNEFSSGAQDVTAIRDFMRMLHSRSTKSGTNVMYLLLFGDASFDYKYRTPRNTNFVPVYQSRESLHPINSYSSDDYYGFLDENEGLWAENMQGDHLLDIGIGRLPVKTKQEAAAIVDKIISYSSPNQFGKWRTQIALVADDADYNEHLHDAEYLANYLERNFPEYTSNKLYLDFFPQIAVSTGQRSPEATAAVDKAIEQGAVITNFVGHGNEISWASEQLLTIPQIENLQNSNKLTFMLTATCEFGRYDYPARTTAAEIALLQPQSGAIGLLTTTRPVFASGNRILNRNFHKYAFKSVNGTMPRLGDLTLLTKNSSLTDSLSSFKGINNRNFTLLADPSLQLAYPAMQAEVTHINGKAVLADTLSALGKVTIAGRVMLASGETAKNFNGDLRLMVFDKFNTRKTLGDEATSTVSVNVRENILYDGNATVKNGLFELAFVVPKDISAQYGTGKITIYATNNTQDAIGVNQSVVIGGTAKNISTDNIPPVINLFMNDESFVFGGSTGNSPTLLVKLSDENGINTAGLGTGHEITASLDNNTADPIILNDYYTSDANTYQTGQVKYIFKDLAPGPHAIKVQAWDTYNNSSEEYIEFYVSDAAKISLDHLLNHPNPFSTKTTFHFDHNRAGENLDVQIQIFTISGKLVKSLETTCYASKAHFSDLTWDGKDEYNDILAKGVYVYKINVRSQQDGSKISKFEKLVILN